MQRSDRAVTWTMDNFDTNMMRLLDVIGAFPAVCAVRIKLFGSVALTEQLS
jgi:hypothetical protein